MKRFLKLNETLQVNPAAIVALQDNGNGSVQVTLARDVTFTVQGTTEEIVSRISDLETENYIREVELAGALVPGEPATPPVVLAAAEPTPGVDPSGSTAAGSVDLGAGPDVLTLGTTDHLAGLDGLAGTATTSQPGEGSEQPANPSEVNAQATEQAVNQ